jgi:hypothetical protein
MAIASEYDEYNVAIYTADGGQAAEEDCVKVRDWLDDSILTVAPVYNCNILMTGYWPNMWSDMAALTAAFPHLMFEVYAVPYHEDRRQWYFSDGKVAEAEEITAWSEYDPSELKPIRGGTRD